MYLFLMYVYIIYVCMGYLCIYIAGDFLFSENQSSWIAWWITSILAMFHRNF